MLGRPVLLRLREDNTACAKVVTAGYSKKLRHLKRVHRVSLASVKEQLDRDDVELGLVGTSDQKAEPMLSQKQLSLHYGPKPSKTLECTSMVTPSNIHQALACNWTNKWLCSQMHQRQT